MQRHLLSVKEINYAIFVRAMTLFVPVKNPSIWTKISEQTVLIQIRLLLKQSDQGLHCLPIYTDLSRCITALKKCSIFRALR